MTELHELTTRELAVAYRCGEADPERAVEHRADRIAAHDAVAGTFGTLVTVIADAGGSRRRPPTDARPR